MKQIEMKAVVRRLDADKAVVTASRPKAPAGEAPAIYVEFNVRPEESRDAFMCALEYAQMKFGSNNVVIEEDFV